MSRQPRAELAKAVLHEARKLVADHGLSALTARTLAQAVGCSVGTLYNLYPNLDTVRLHLNAELLDRLQVVMAAADEAVPANAAVETRLLALAKAYLSFARSNLNLFQTLIDNRPPVLTEPLPDWLLERIVRLRRGIEMAVTPLIPNASADRLERAAATTWAAVNGLVEGIVSGNLAPVSSADPEVMMAELVETLAAGLRVRG
jgi:AcrR family transcriptional regulator